MSVRSVAAQEVLTWMALAEELRGALERKLEGLWGWERDADVFESLSVDDQQALVILVRRFLELGLWDAVRRVTNVYGKGGVGMDFAAWPLLRSRLERRREFTTWFARHRDNSGGFMEKGKGGPALHIVYIDGDERRWAAHFDLYSPLSSPLNALRHLYHEKLRKQVPDWQEIDRSLRQSSR